MPYNSEGRAAFHRGVDAGDSPYQDTVRRIQWMSGWCNSKNDYYNSLARLQLEPPA
jgi:ribosome modulation factor